MAKKSNLLNFTNLKSSNDDKEVNSSKKEIINFSKY